MCELRDAAGRMRSVWLVAAVVVRRIGTVRVVTSGLDPPVVVEFGLFGGVMIGVLSFEPAVGHLDDVFLCRYREGFE